MQCKDERFEDDGKVKTHPKTMKPTWDIDCTYDAEAAAEFGKDVGKIQMKHLGMTITRPSKSRIRSTLRIAIGCEFLRTLARASTWRYGC